MLTCKLLRNVVIVSGLSLVAGIFLELVVQLAPFAVPSVAPAVLSALAASAVFLAAALLGVIFLASLLPGLASRLNECQH